MREIVGIVSVVKSSTISGAPDSEVYAPQAANDCIGDVTIVVRTSTDPNLLSPRRARWSPL
jgi:hypothetical protein